MAENVSNSPDGGGSGVNQHVGAPIPLKGGESLEVYGLNNPSTAPKQEDVDPLKDPSTVSKPTNTLFDATKSDKYVVSAITSKLNTTDNIYTNSNGDIVNLDNKVLIPKSELDLIANTNKTADTTKLSTFIDGLKDEFVVTKDNAEFSVTIKDGNLVTSAGEVVMSKEEFLNHLLLTYNNVDDLINGTESTEELLLDNAFVDNISKLSGYEALDEEGNILEFEPTIEGLAKREAYIVDQYGTQLANDKLNEFISTYGLQDAINYAMAKGSLDGFSVDKSYSNITVDKANETGMIELIVEAEMSRGRNRQTAMTMVDSFKKAGIMEAMANDALSYLKAQEDNAKLARRQAAIEAEQTKLKIRAADNDYYKARVEAGVISNFKIPETIRITDSKGIIRPASRKDFLDFLTIPVNKGYTSNEILEANQSREEKLLLSYLRFTNYDISQLIDQMAETKIANKYKSSSTKFKLNSGSKTTQVDGKPVSPIRRFS